MLTTIDVTPAGMVVTGVLGGLRASVMTALYSVRRRAVVVGHGEVMERMSSMSPLTKE